MSSPNTYDVIIIGAGMSGLVCGCYLAQAGMRVLIAERHHKPGGYCTSFRRKDFMFDAAAHSFGSNREGGIFRKVLSDLGVDRELAIRRYDPSDVIKTPDFLIQFRTEPAETIDDLRHAFPREKQIPDFINFLTNPQPSAIAALRKRTFKDLLDQYFEDDRLKAVLSFPLFGNGGAPPSLMSAFTGSKIFTEFMLDGGYYPDGGMQQLPDGFVKRFKSFGGEIRLSSAVREIITEGNRASGVVLESREFLPCRYVISNCDARQTFFQLLQGRQFEDALKEKLQKMHVSLSMFIIYIGVQNSFDGLPKPGTTLWYLPDYDLDKLYLRALDPFSVDLSKYLFRVSPDGKSIIAMTNCSFKNEQFWSENKQSLLEQFLKDIEKTCVPDLSRFVVYQEAATPLTLFRYTLNAEGAAYGWESRPEQFLDSAIRKPPFLRNLILTGHWTTYGQGLAGVVYVGRETAKSLLRFEGI